VESEGSQRQPRLRLYAFSTGKFLYKKAHARYPTQDLSVPLHRKSVVFPNLEKIYRRFLVFCQSCEAQSSLMQRYSFLLMIGLHRLCKQEWPGSFCDGKKGCRWPSVEPTKGWLLHGLWPEFNNGSWPEYCDPNYPFNMTLIQVRLSRLLQSLCKDGSPSSNACMHFNYAA